MSLIAFALRAVIVIAFAVLSAGIGMLLLIGYYAVIEVCVRREQRR